MGNANFISLIERYHEFRDPICELVASIVTGVDEAHLVDDQERQRRELVSVAGHYPFVEILYLLDGDGIQVSEYVVEGNQTVSRKRDQGKGRDRGQRPYFRSHRAADPLVVTEPYLSTANRQLCISASRRLETETGEVYYLVLDFDLAGMLGFLMGDAARQRFEPFFKAVYVAIVVGLLGVVGLLLVSAFREGFAAVFGGNGAEHQLKPLGVIIFLTLALAIFDLARTTLEEEVLMSKDIFRHSSTRRTITRFVAAILIAVSIEALLLMFKAALGDGEHLAEAAWMMFASVGLMVGLGIYVYLGARAEAILRNQPASHAMPDRKPD